MQHKENIEMQQALLLDKFKKLKKRRINNIELLASPVEDMGGIPFPSPERVLQMMNDEERCKEQMEVIAFGIKILSWVLEGETPQPLDIFKL